jgi:hypothetical protein
MWVKDRCLDLPSVTLSRGLGEELEDLRYVRSGNAHAVVLFRHDHVNCRKLRCEGYLPARIRVSRRVVERIGNT